MAAQRLVGTYFPFVALLGDVADALVLGVGAGLIARGQLTTGALIAFVLYIDLFFSPIQQLSQVFDSWQQTRISVGRIAELMSMDTLTPEHPQPLSRGPSGRGTCAWRQCASPTRRQKRRRGGRGERHGSGPADPRLLVSDGREPASVSSGVAGDRSRDRSGRDTWPSWVRRGPASRPW